MVKLLKNIFNSVTDFFDMIGSVVDFIINFVKDLVYVIKLVGEFVLKIPDMFTWLPATVVALIVTVFGIVVIYKILGRE